MALYKLKKRKFWVIKAFERGIGRTVAWEIGGRDTATFRRLYKKVSQITDNCIFYTDKWDSFAKVLSPK